MSNTVKEAFDFYNMTKDIQERKQIIDDYRTYGILDRNKVIDKITELQHKDVEVATATNTVQAIQGAVILNYADNNTLIENLLFQINILEGKLVAKTIKNATEDK